MILVTGGTGFVGSAVSSALYKKGVAVSATTRKSSDQIPAGVIPVPVNNLSDMAVDQASDTWNDLHNALKMTEVIIHTAARVHVMNESVSDPLSEFRKVNVDATLSLARQAAAAGVKRFIFISSIKVNGEMTEKGKPFTPDDVHVPNDPYGLSKYEAEQSLLKLAQETDMDVVIIRPPLVYGPGVKANFESMMKWINKGLPLPLGAVNNKRSLVALENLVSFILHCADIENTPQAANQVFLISDNEDVSTTQLLQKVARAFGKKARLLPVPVYLMKTAAKLIGKSAVADRLFGSLQVDSSKAQALLGWKPVVTMDEQLAKTVQAYQEQQHD